jgi:peptide/nickel transport system permease protein
MSEIRSETISFVGSPSTAPVAEPPQDIEVWPNVHAPDALRQTSVAVQFNSRRRALSAFLANPAAILGLVILLTLLVGALAAPLVFPDDPLSIVGRPLQWPGQTLSFPLGTDSLGRNVAAELLYGARITLSIGLIATVVCLGIGILIGALAGYFGGLVDDALVRLIEVFQTIPAFILLIVLVAIAEPSIPAITIAIGVVSWPPVARLVRAEFRSLREKDFVLAARALGYGHRRIIFAEILPNALPPVIVMASVTIATAILMESALSFMGLGDPNVVSWGSMIGAGRQFLRTAWYLCAIPGLAIVIAVFALNLVGDGLNEALNPRLNKRP